MNITKKIDGATLMVMPTGRLDTRSAVDLESVVNSGIADAKMLVFDFAQLEYISSAGLRVLLASHKTMMKQGSMVVKNCSEEIMEIFDVTGFTDILNIE